METVTALVRSIFQKDSLDDCSLEELQAMARQYSYFAPVQFLLAEKLKTTDENLYREQLQKLSLHFNNPLWLDYLLNSYNTEDPDSESRPEMTEATKQEIIESLSIEEAGTSEPLINEVEQIVASHSPGSSTQEVIVSSEKNEETADLRVEENHADVDVETTERPKDQLDEESQVSVPPLPGLDQEPSETELTFQPYHTVDYFASQGIKFVPEEKPTDRFSKQLKSFTEWLKSMKRLPESETSKITDIVSEKKVEQMAEHSIDEGEVITETMAEVWIKQGNTQKAIETYNKLSLLNPDKSAYFASLAEQLKNS
jgi:hypothetical protein